MDSEKEKLYQEVVRHAKEVIALLDERRVSLYGAADVFRWRVDQLDRACKEVEKA